MGTAPQVFEAIIAVMAAMAKEGIAKSGTNQQQNYKFRGIDAVYAALAGKLSEHRLCVLPRVTAREQVERATKNGGCLFYTTLTVEYDLVSADDGSKHTICTVGEAMDSADKSSNKAMSAAYKYAMIQAFCIPVEGDDDADATTHDVEPGQKMAPARTPRPEAPRTPRRQADAANQSAKQLEHEITTLTITLMNAAKKGGKTFNEAWDKFPGAARKSIYANKGQMQKFSDECAAADNAEGNTPQDQSQREDA